MNAPHAVQSLRKPLPEQMITALRAQFGDRFTMSNAVREHHGKDESPYPVMLPDAVIFIESTEGETSSPQTSQIHSHGLDAFLYFPTGRSFAPVITSTATSSGIRLGMA